MRAIFLATIGTILVGYGCGDDGSITSGTAPRMEVSEGARPIAHRSTIAVSDQRSTFISVANTGSGPLEIRAIDIVSEPPGAFTLSLTPVPSVEEPVLVQPQGVIYDFILNFDSSVATNQPSATITITTNKTIEGTTTFSFDVAPEAATPRLLVQPSTVDFGTVPENSTSTQALVLLNTGSAPLELTGFFLAGHPGYQLAMSGTEWSVSPETASEGVTFFQPLVIGAGESLQASVTYTASGPEPAEGQLTLLSNDPAAENGTKVPLYSNVAGPCINVVPTHVEFGAKLVGDLATVDVEIQSCGDRDLEISDIRFVDDANGLFSLDAAALGAFPVVVAPNQAVTLPVSYFPDRVAQLGSDGEFDSDEGVFRISSNAYLAEFDVEVSGHGTDGSCPTANITVAEGEEVIPQTVLHLSGNGSTSTSGAIAGYEWDVVAPSGSASVFLPSRFVANPTYEANLAGEYTFKLKVFDAAGTPSCTDAEYTVFVTSTEAIHVELIWTTPGDPDETDTGDIGGASVGSDVDLHFVHPSARGCDNNGDGIKEGYFDSLFDTYFGNPLPNWGGAGTNDNPRLDRDDVDGAGPENLNLDFPEFGMSYKIGAHYWDDWGFGSSIATVRVFIYGVKTFEWGGVQLYNHDMWTVANVAWPGGAVTRVEHSPNVPVIDQNYQFDPLFCLF